MNIGIIGLGLIGGSLGRAFCKKTAHTVYANDSDENALFKGELLNAYHERLSNDNVSKLDVVFICVYPNMVESVMRTLCPLLKDGAIVTDCAGIKRGIVHTMSDLAHEYPNLIFIGGHPMAGREFTGVEHSTAGLMEKSTALLVNVNASLDGLTTLKQLYLEIGAEGVVMTTAEEHDKIIAGTSQLAHIVSCAYVKMPISHTHYGFSAGSFRDMTRVARLNADMWTDLMLTNADNLTDELDSLIERLRQMSVCLAENDALRLRTLLKEGNDIKLEIENNRLKKLNQVIEN